MKRQPQRPDSRPPAAPSTTAPLEPATARELAFVCLQAFDDSGAYLSDSLDRLQARPLSPADRAMAMELSYTVLRRRLTVDAILQTLVDRDPASVERDLWTILQLGVVQVVLLPGLPIHAAVHETVELAKRVNARWGGMVNGVLRSAQRLLTDDFADSPLGGGVPVVEIGPALEGEIQSRMTIRFRQLQKPVLPEFDRDPTAYIAAAFSMPRDLMARWSQGWDPTAAMRLAAWFTTPGVMSLRVNLLRTSRDQLLDKLRSSGANCWPGELSECVRLEESARIARLPGFEEGEFSVQDESAMRIIDVLDPQPREHILDLCAAPGGKSTHAAERMRDEGQVLACDLSFKRLRLVDDSARRLGLMCIETRPVSDDTRSIPDGPFDGAVVDAPCSNMGVLGKRPEARWRLTENDFIELPALQLRLLTAAADRVKPGGRCVYSTCSIDALENEGVVREFLKANPAWKLQREHVSVPAGPADGGYVALLRRGSF